MRTAGTLIALLVVAGCASTPAPEPTTIATPPTTLATTTTTTLAGEPADTIATRVAPQIARLRSQIAAEDKCTSFECSEAAALIRRWDAIGATAREIRDTLERSDPPASMAELVDTTVQLAGKAFTARGAWSTCLDNNQGGSMETCASEQTAYETAWRALGDGLAGWRAFGV